MSTLSEGGRFIFGYQPPTDRPVATCNRSFPTITAGRKRRRFFSNGIPIAFQTPGGAPGPTIRASGASVSQIAPPGFVPGDE